MGRRLVDEQHGGLQHERPRDGDALLLPDRELGHRALPEPVEPEPLEQVVYVHLPAEETARQPDVLCDGQLGHEPEALRHVAECCPRASRR